MEDAQRFQNYQDQMRTRVESRAITALSINRFKVWDRALKPYLAEMQRAGSVLDHGCGSGEFSAYLRARTQAQVTSFDPHVSAFSNPALIAGESYDWVFSHHVIEHIPDDQLEGFVQSLARMVRPGGRMLIATPNGMNPISYSYYMSTDATHVRMHSPDSLAMLLKSAGFEIVGAHRELPQAYDVSSWLKTLAWAACVPWLKLALFAHGAGMRGRKYPITLAATFYVVAKRVGD